VGVGRRFSLRIQKRRCGPPPFIVEKTPPPEGGEKRFLGPHYTLKKEDPSF